MRVPIKEVSGNWNSTALKVAPIGAQRPTGILRVSRMKQTPSWKRQARSANDSVGLCPSGCCPCLPAHEKAQALCERVHRHAALRPCGATLCSASRTMHLAAREVGLIFTAWRRAMWMKRLARALLEHANGEASILAQALANIDQGGQE